MGIVATDLSVAGSGRLRRAVVTICQTEVGRREAGIDDSAYRISLTAPPLGT